jgi:AAA+ ATPase superfamily predicted ATPase
MFSVSLHSNPLFASTQLLFWLLFRPSAWQALVEKIKLSPDFALHRLSLEQWREPLLQRLLLIYIAGPLFIGIMVGLWLYSLSWLWGTPEPTITPLKGVIYAMTLCFVSGVISGITVSVAFSFVASMVSSLLIGFFFFSGEWYRDAILSGIFAVSLASNVLIGLTSEESSLKIGSIFISLLVTNVILISILALGSVVISFPFLDPQVLVLTFCLIFLLGFTFQKWKLAGILGTVIWIITTVLINIVEPHTLIKSVTGSLSNGIFFTLLFALPYLLARKIATTSLSGIVAGLLSCWSVYTFFFMLKQDSPIFFLLSLIALGLGWWRQIWLNKSLDITRFFQAKFLQGVIFEGASQVKQVTAADDQEIENPYALVPLRGQNSLFVGRQDVGERIKILLKNQQSSPILLSGQRRMGKTSLILQLSQMLPDKYVPLFVDFQGSATARNHSGFLYKISRAMRRSARENRQFPELSRDALKDDPFTVFDEWLDDIEDNVKGYTFLITFDEFEALEGVFKKERLDKDLVLGTFRHIIQHRPCFKILMAGAYRLEDFPGWANYLINVDTVQLGYLSEDEARQLIENPMEDFLLSYTPEAIQRVLSLTRCHPACVQALCKEIVILKNQENTKTRYLAQKEDVEKAIPKTLEHSKYYFIDIIEKRSVEEKQVLSFLAEKGEGAVISRVGLSEQCENIDEVLSNLVERQLIEETAEGFRFQVELIRRFFSQKEKD